MKKTFKELTKNIDMILFNWITNIENDLQLEAWEDFYLDEEKESVFKDIFQYFAIDRFDWEYLSRKTWMPLYYSEKCNLFLLWIDFLDNWENLSFEV